MLEVLLPVGLAGLVWLVYDRFRGGPPPSAPAGEVTFGEISLAPAGLDAGKEAAPVANHVPNVMAFAEVRQIVEQMIAWHFPKVSPQMVMAMVEIESAFRPKAVRHEPHLNDASYGLMQTLYSTARWLRDDMGFNKYWLDGPSDLYKPGVSVYFGCAYIAWLQTYKGKARSEDWIVMSYNGGPGADNSMTRNHLSKYHAAKARQAGEWG